MRCPNDGLYRQCYVTHPNRYLPTFLYYCVLTVSNYCELSKMSKRRNRPSKRVREQTRADNEKAEARKKEQQEELKRRLGINQ